MARSGDWTHSSYASAFRPGASNPTLIPSEEEQAQNSHVSHNFNLGHIPTSGSSQYASEMEVPQPGGDASLP